jgi:Family of unknown function (DUF5320)
MFAKLKNITSSTWRYIMPRGNGTGPMGAGPMTGRASGYCAGFATPGFANPVGYGGMGRGMGRAMGQGGGFRNRGGGFGFRNHFFASDSQQFPAMTAEQEKEYMTNHIKALENELEAAKQGLDEL